MKIGRRLWTPPVITRRRAIQLLEDKAQTTGDAETAAACLMAIAALRQVARHGL